MNNYLKLGSILFNNSVICTERSLNKQLQVFKVFSNSLYTFSLTEKANKNTRVTRPKVSKNLGIPLTYEQSQFVERIGVTKSWNCWNTCKEIIMKGCFFILIHNYLFLNIS